MAPRVMAGNAECLWHPSKSGASVVGILMQFYEAGGTSIVGWHNHTYGTTLLFLQLFIVCSLQARAMQGRADCHRMPFRCFWRVLCCSIIGFAGQVWPVLFYSAGIRHLQASIRLVVNIA
jgi:hypothetical protein